MKAKDGDLYMLADGTYADPKECKAGDDGKLCHTNGVPVAMNPDGQPMTMSHVSAHNETVKVSAEEAAEAAAAAVKNEADKP